MLLGPEICIDLEGETVMEVSMDVGGTDTTQTLGVVIPSGRARRSLQQVSL